VSEFCDFKLLDPKILTTDAGSFFVKKI
jgi:hypothetical protein